MCILVATLYHQHSHLAILTKLLMMKANCLG